MWALSEAVQAPPHGPNRDSWNCWGVADAWYEKRREEERGGVALENVAQVLLPLKTSTAHNRPPGLRVFLSDENRLSGGCRCL